MTRQTGGISLELARRIDTACNQYETEWKSGQRPQLETIVAAVAETEQAALLQGLLPVDFELRSGAGEKVSTEEYVRRFPRFEQVVRGLNLEDSAGGVKSVPSKAGRRSSETLNKSRADVSTASTHVQSHVPSDLPEKFGRYRILKKLGQGGMGAVYLAHDSQLDRQVALKVPHFSGGAGGEILERFYIEARAAATIHHPHLCPVFDVGEIQGRPYLTMAFIEGVPLTKVISGVKPEKPLPERQVALLVRKLASALEEAHRKGVVHRDLKPPNIMLDQRREPVIMDFGLARRTQTDDARITRTGAVMGSPAYMSPEQVLGKINEIGPPTDIYSLGVILYELLTGKLPFQGPVTAVLGQILSVEPPPIAELRPDIDPALAAICAKAMAKKIEERYSSMGDVAKALGEYLKKKAEPEKKSEPATRSAEVSFPELPLDVSSPIRPLSNVSQSSVISRLVKTVPATYRTRNVAGIAAGGLAAVLVLLAVLVFKLQTSEGTLEVEVNEPGAMVTVLDGQGTVEITRASDGGSLKISVEPGKHTLKVEKDGFRVFTKEFSVANGESNALKARLVPIPPEKKVASKKSEPEPAGSDSAVPPPSPHRSSPITTTETSNQDSSVSATTGNTNQNGDIPIVDLLKTTDLKRDSIVGEWKIEAGRLVSPGTLASRIHIGDVLPEEYTLRAEVCRKSEGFEAFGFGLPIGEKGVLFIMDVTPDGKNCGLEMIDGKVISDNETCISGQRLGSDSWHVIECRVSRRRLVARCNSTIIINWPIDPARVEIPFWFAPRDSKRGFILTNTSVYHVRRLEFEPRVDHALDALKPGDTVAPELLVPRKSERSTEELLPNAIPSKESPSATTASLSPEQQPGRDAPSDNDLAAAKKVLLEAYQADYAGSTNAVEKLALARKLRKEAETKRNEPVEHYALLDEARLLGIQAGDAREAVEAVRRMRTLWSIDGSGLLDATLAALSKVRRTPEQNRLLASVALDQLPGEVAAENYSTAKGLLRMAQTGLRGVKDKELASRIDAVVKELPALEKSRQEAEKARLRLKDDSDDAAANLTLGLYTCLIQEDWPRGLELLTRGGSAEFRELANKELAQPRLARDKRALGDSWWDLGQKQTTWKRRCLARAAVWYEQAWPNLVGLEETNISQRLVQIDAQAGEPLRDRTVSRYFELMRHLRTTRPAIDDHFKKLPGGYDWGTDPRDANFSRDYGPDGYFMENRVKGPSGWQIWAPGSLTNPVYRFAARIAKGNADDNFGLKFVIPEDRSIEVYLHGTGAVDVYVPPGLLVDDTGFIEANNVHSLKTTTLAAGVRNSQAEWDALTVAIVSRSVEVFVNGRQVCPAIPLNRDVSPVRTMVMMRQSAGPENVCRAEYRRMTTWELPKRSN